MRERRAEFARAMRAWVEVKERLRSEMDPRDFNHFVRPMLLLNVLSGFFMLLALPPNARMFERARNFAKHGPLLPELQARGFTLAGFTAYPTSEALVRLREEHPRFFAGLSGPLRARAEAALAEFSAEDARDCQEVA